MATARRLTRNILSSWLGFFVYITVMVVLTPVVLDALGGTRYGVWALLSTLTGYYGLLDAGARASVTRNVARYLALGDYHRMNRVASAGFAILLGCSGVLMAATILIAVVGTWVFRIPDDVATEFRWSTLAMGSSVALQFCFFVHSSSLGARQRNDLSMAAHILMQVLYACGVPWLLSSGFGLIGLTTWLSATNLAAYVIQWPIARRVIPELSISLRLVDRKGLKEFAHFGVWQCGVNLSQQVIGCSDPIVISIMLSTTAVAPFYLATRIARCFARFFMPISGVLVPVLTHFDAVGDKERIRRFFLQGTRLMWVLSVALGAIAACWAGDFFALWVGEQHAGFQGRVSDLFGVLLIAAIVTAPQQIALPIFLAFGRQRMLAALFIAEAAVNIAISLALVGRFGLLGVAWGTCIPAVVFQGVVHPLVTCRMLDIPASSYFRLVMTRPLAFAVVLTALAMYRPAVTVQDWITLTIAGVLSGLVAIAAAIAVGLDREDRQRFLHGPLGKIAQLGLRFRRPTPDETATDQPRKAA